MTNIFQPLSLDVSVNKATKNELRIKCYSQLYTTEVHRQLATGVSADEVKVDLRISVLKPKHAEWIVQIFDRFQSNYNRGQEIIKAGFRKSCTEALDMTTFPSQDPFATIV